MQPLLSQLLRAAKSRAAKSEHRLTDRIPDWSAKDKAFIQLFQSDLRLRFLLCIVPVLVPLLFLPGWYPNDWGALSVVYVYLLAWASARGQFQQQLIQSIKVLSRYSNFPSVSSVRSL